MKKSQLRKIIRESIKELMVEQSQPLTESMGSSADVTMVGYPALIVGSNMSMMANYQCASFQNNRWHSLCCMNQPTGFLDDTSGPTPTAQGGTGGNYYSGAQHLWNNIGLNLPPDQTPCVPGCIQAVSMVSPISSTQILNFLQQHTTGNIIYDPSSSLPSSGTIQPMQYFNGTTGECYDWIDNVTAPPPPPPLVAGCTVSGSSNYDMYADGCEVNGVVDINDVTCCVPIQPGGSTTPTNVGPPMASNDTKFATPTPDTTSMDPGIKRMQKIANISKK